MDCLASRGSHNLATRQRARKLGLSLENAVPEQGFGIPGRLQPGMIDDDGQFLAPSAVFLDHDIPGFGSEGMGSDLDILSENLPNDLVPARGAHDVAHCGLSLNGS